MVHLGVLHGGSGHGADGLARGAADRNGDDRVTLDEAYDYTYHQTLKSSGATTRLQHPTYRYDLEGRGGLVLTRLFVDGARAGRLRIPEAGRYMVMERRAGGAVVAEVEALKTGARLALPPGRYFVQQRGRRSLREYRFNLAAGGQVDLGELPYETVAYARLVRKGGLQESSHGIVALVGGRGPVLQGEAITAQVAVQYAVDLRLLSLGIRLRGGQAAADGVGSSTRRELAVGLSSERVFDLAHVSVGVGLLAEAVRHDQAFSTMGQSSQRAGWGAGFGGLLSLQRQLWSGLDLRVEGGPMTQVLSVALIERGAVVGEELRTPLTWRAGAGLRWSFR